MANVIDINLHRKKSTEPPTLGFLAAQCTEEISENWERFARNNRLNDYFLSSTPVWSMSHINYLSDLNAISVIESKINLALLLAAPGTAGASQIGWVAAFEIKGVRIETPFMLCEAYARCFNILLFLKLGRELTHHGLHL